jgi:integrase
MSLEEMTRLLQSAGGPKYQAALGVAYGAGLRANEVVHLSVGDIDSERMVIRVEQGKGKRDRYAMLSPTLLELLRAWWQHARAQRQMLPGGGLSLDGERWVACRPGFFLPVRVLSKLFRRLFLEKLCDAHRERQNRYQWNTTDPSMNIGVPMTSYFTELYRKVTTLIPIARLPSMTAWHRPAVSSLDACQTPAR